MSCCEIYSINLDGEIEHYGDAKNSWGGAMHIWETLSLRYFDRRFGAGYGEEDERQTKEFWAEFSRKPQRLLPHERIALGFTYDRVWVKRENIGRLADALKTFYDRNPTFMDRRGEAKPIAPTILEIVEHLRRATADETIQGVCFNQTSVNCGTWDVKMTLKEAKAEYGEEYTPDEFADERPSRSFRFGKDTQMDGKDVWELFESIDE
jgi:hypothetical protein